MSRPAQPVTFVVVTSPTFRAQAVTEMRATRTARYDRIRCLLGRARNANKQRTFRLEPGVSIFVNRSCGTRPPAAKCLPAPDGALVYLPQLKRARHRHRFHVPGAGLLHREPVGGRHFRAT